MTNDTPRDRWKGGHRGFAFLMVGIATCALWALIPSRASRGQTNTNQAPPNSNIARPSTGPVPAPFRAAQDDGASRGPAPSVNKSDGSVIAVDKLLRPYLTNPRTRDTIEWSAVTPVDVPEGLPPWLTGKMWAVNVRDRRESYTGNFINEATFTAFLRGDTVLWVTRAGLQRRPPHAADVPFEIGRGERLSPPETPSYQAIYSMELSGMKAMPFGKAGATFGADLLADREHSLWNALSTAVFVVVEVSGQPGNYDSSRVVEFTAVSGGKTILKRSSKVGVLNEYGKYYLPFLLEGPYCEPVKLSARLSGTKAPLVGTLNFECGE